MVSTLGGGLNVLTAGAGAVVVAADPTVAAGSAVLGDGNHGRGAAVAVTVTVGAGAGLDVACSGSLPPSQPAMGTRRLIHTS